MKLRCWQRVEIIDRLEFANEIKTLQILQDALTEREKKKKQLHKVFKDSFDAKAIFSEKFLIQKLNYTPARRVIQAGITIP